MVSLSPGLEDRPVVQKREYLMSKDHHLLPEYDDLQLGDSEYVLQNNDLISLLSIFRKQPKMMRITR